ncbi:hypothetical protein [Priestia aryabhattai]
MTIKNEEVIKLRSGCNIFEEKLLSVGVSKEHISFLKQNKLKSLGELAEFFELGKVEEVKLVPVSKIKGLNGLRGASNYSWLDHADGKAGNLCKRRLDSFQKKLDNTSLDSFRKWFESDEFLNTHDKVQFNYYDKYDEYYVGNGNHRTLWAKLVDAKYINARVVTHHYNFVKHENYKKNYEEYHQKIKNSDENFLKLLNTCNLELKYGDNKVERDQIAYEDFRISTYKSPHLDSKYRINYNNKSSIKEYFRLLRDKKVLLEKIMDRYFFCLNIPRKWRVKFIEVRISQSKEYHSYHLLKALNKRNWSPKCEFKEWKKIKQTLQ